ncbi:MAG: hypothetical protein DMD45_13315 [Gemmatimonadetes bacterium]|nr:MAG: hypothetical protein DMD45_13315 [Gemmatimonadota bacterium]
MAILRWPPISPQEGPERNSRDPLRSLNRLATQGVVTLDSVSPCECRDSVEQIDMHRRIWQVTFGGISVAAIVTACGDGPTESRPGDRGIHVARATLVDTVLVTHSLIVRVQDSAGRPAAGVVVRFEAQPVANPDYSGFFDYPVLVAAVDSQRFTILATATTDGRGGASVQTRFGIRAGPADLLLRVPELGFVDSVRFTITPGAAAGVTVAPRDTAIYATHGYTLRAHARDQYGNARDDPVAFTLVYGPVSADRTTGAVVASAIGRGAIVARSVARSDTAYVSVVPPGWVASQEFDPGNGGPIGLFLMQLDGSGRQRLAPGLDNSFIPQGFGWSPDGQELALVRGTFVNLLTPGGVEHALVEMSNAVSIATRFSRDGHWLYFALAYGSSTQPQGLYRVAVDGTGLEHLGQAGTDYFPAPSHDGQSVAYVSYRSPCGVDTCIRVLDLSTNQDRAYGAQDFLTRGSHVAWSPTADLIAYVSGPHLMLVRSDGTQPRALADNLSYVKWMDWSPDGRWLLVAETGVTLFDIQTGLRLPLAQFLSYGATAWRP